MCCTEPAIKCSSVLQPAESTPACVARRVPDRRELSRHSWSMTGQGRGRLMEAEHGTAEERVAEAGADRPRAQPAEEAVLSGVQGRGGPRHSDIGAAHWGHCGGLPRPVIAASVDALERPGSTRHRRPMLVSARSAARSAPSRSAEPPMESRHAGTSAPSTTSWRARSRATHHRPAGGGHRRRGRRAVHAERDRSSHLAAARRAADAGECRRRSQSEFEAPQTELEADVLGFAAELVQTRDPARHEADA